MANVQKLPSGNYRIRKTYRGKVYSLTVPYKPRKAEAEQLIAEFIGNSPTPSTETLGDCCRAYLDLKNNVLSPSTLRAYRSYLRNTPVSLQNARITALTPVAIQTYINAQSGLKSAKTVRNISVLTVKTFFRKKVKKVFTFPGVGFIMVNVAKW